MLKGFFTVYDATTELLVLATCIVMLLIIAISKPVNSYKLRLVKAGFILSILSILSHLAMLAATFNKHGGNKDFMFRYFLFAAFYIAVLDVVYIYVENLTYKKKKFRRIAVINTLVATVLYAIIFFAPLYKNILLVEEETMYRMTPYVNSCVGVSLLASVFMGISIYINRKNLSRAVIVGGSIFVPIAAIGTVSQFFFTTSFFICGTYTMPFIVFYILFHGFKFDENLGFQNYDAESYMLNRYINGKKNFIQISVKFPKLENRDISDISDDINYIGNVVCRDIERMNFGTRIYSVSRFHFSLLAPVKNEEEFEQYKIKFFSLIGNINNIDKVNYNLHYKAVVSGRLDNIENAEEYMTVVKQVFERIDTSDTNEILEVTQKDADLYKRAALIEKALLDISTTGNLDDERVLLYIQPIYNIETGRFKTGEALMRLKLDGKIYYPDSFISVAERIGCIHTLTKIILNKAAKKTLQLAKYPDFEAISVNVSTTELADFGAAEEFSKIISDVGANPKNIRLEITESTTIGDYSNIIKNMFDLHGQGVYFYLDDFGTGFSNLDRIVGMPFRTIKFDKSLLYKAIKDEKTDKMFRMLVDFCKGNKLTTVIEGVEDLEQKYFVEEVGFDYIQGYLYSKPVEEGECNSFYEAS